jgi:hypothetical protein
MKRRYTFKTIVDDDVRHKVPSVDFQFLVSVYLNDPDGWISKGYSFEHSETNPDVLIRLSSPTTIEKHCGQPRNLSCAILGGDKMFLNAVRWLHGSKESRLDLENYRQYLVSHEIGHILGYDHKTCPCIGCRAPIMMQQTLGIGKCIPNTKITEDGH